MEHDSFVQLEGVGEAVIRDIDRFRQHHLQLVEFVNGYQRIVDVYDHHPVHGGTYHSRTETGHFLMAYPGHGSTLLGTAHFGCRGFRGRFIRGGFAAIPG